MPYGFVNDTGYYFDSFVVGRSPGVAAQQGLGLRSQRRIGAGGPYPDYFAADGANIGPGGQSPIEFAELQTQRVRSRDRARFYLCGQRQIGKLRCIIHRRDGATR